jgi:hemin uptake protein HemP
MAENHVKKPMRTDLGTHQVTPGSGGDNYSGEASSVFGSNRTVNHEPPKVIRWDDLAGGDRTVLIEFNELQYQLRLTKAGKLILTK